MPIHPRSAFVLIDAEFAVVQVQVKSGQVNRAKDRLKADFPVTWHLDVCNANLGMCYLGLHKPFIGLYWHLSPTLSLLYKKILDYYTKMNQTLNKK
jgi:hypothetical protein